ncbi:glycosyltransferase [Haloarcula montana]|uniref:glycosyltransferase n=1 Tax=Haloarcula montana TaxID=3111776 RepID=UPI002D780175|nr:glycosyltransferase [Haloarcula sp. GH36]
MTDTTPVSVVIVTYNEEERIRDCIESVLAATHGLVDAEIVLVDSNSTDRTVDIAAEYPVTIVRIPDDELTTPGAGRYIGTATTDGDPILFVDGDMVIKRPWLERALSTLAGRADIGAVDGYLDTPPSETTAIEVDAVRGVSLYSRDALRSVGGFDPYLRSLEDIHLGYQLTGAGYTLVRLPEVAAEHTSRNSLSEPFRRLKRGYTVGSGQALRRSIGSKRLLKKHLGRIRYRLALAAWLCVGVGAVLFRPAFGLWLLLSVLASGVLVHERGLKGGAGFLIGKLFGLVGVVGGMVGAPERPESFPTERVETVQQGPIVPAATAPVDDGENT